jgi:hypothetical protein
VDIAYIFRSVSEIGARAIEFRTFSYALGSRFVVLLSESEHFMENCSKESRLAE